MPAFLVLDAAEGYVSYRNCALLTRWHPRCCSPSQDHTAETKSHMVCGRLYDNGSAGIRATPPLTISATLWRRIGERHEWVFTFTGDADVFVVDAILAQVNRLIRYTPGEWGFEFLASGPRPEILLQVEHRFDELVRNDVRQSVAIAPRAVPEMSVLLATAAVAGLADGRLRLH